jgi:hypothetical protein
MQLSQVPTKFPIPFASSAGSGYIRAIPTASQIGVQNGAASLTDGFPPLNFLPVGSGGVPPFGQDMNGLLNQITLWNQWNGAGGLCLYDSVFSSAIGGYPKAAMLASSTAGQVWLNATDNNTSNPDASGTGWVGLNQTSIIHSGSDSSGSGNTITVTSVTPAISAVQSNMIFAVTKGASGNTGAITATIAGQSGSVIWANGGAPQSGDWPASAPALVQWNGTDYVILSLISPASIATEISQNFYLPQGLYQTFTTSGTWVVPTGVYKIFVRLWGSGGGGGGAINNGASSAAGNPGGYSEGYFAVTPGSTLTITIGAAGSGGSSSGSNATAGATTSVSPLGIQSTGGGGGFGANGAVQTGTTGGPGVGSGGSLNLTGPVSSLGAVFGGSPIAAQGSGTPFGSGPTTIGSGNAGPAHTGTFPGGGGSGNASTSSSGYAGGPGNTGLVVIQY